MEYETVDLYHEEYGQGTPVVFLHGFPFDHTIWLPLIPYLEKDARLILADLRGAGNSPAPKGVYSMRHMAEDVVNLLDRMGIEKAVIVGHSMGGYVSLAFAHAYPGRVAGLGLVATQAAADSPEKRQSRLRSASSVRRRGVKVVIKNMIGKLTGREELVGPLTEIMLAGNPVGVEGALRGMAERPDMTGELSNMCAPSVVIGGEKDSFLSKENMEMMAQMLPMGWMVEVPGAGHMLMMEEPEQVANALRPLIQRAVTTTG